jgi:hypothetical protein
MGIVIFLQGKLFQLYVDVELSFDFDEFIHPSRKSNLKLMSDDTVCCRIGKKTVGEFID